MILQRHEALESTNLHLLQMMAGRDVPPWTVVVADTQRGGLGRSGRFWWSPRGGLYMSVLVKPAPGPESLSRVPILASLAVMDSVRGLVQEPVRVKWPNDVLVGGKKLAGVLIQARTSGTGPGWLVAGFGVNVRRPEDAVPQEIRDSIIFLEDLGAGNADRFNLARTIAAALRDRVVTLSEESWKRAVEDWSRSAFWDKMYAHRAVSGEIRGIPVRLAGDGGLVLATEAGEVKVISGEVTETDQGQAGGIHTSDA